MVQTAVGVTRERPLPGPRRLRRSRDKLRRNRRWALSDHPDTGLCRFRLGSELSSPTPYRQARVDFRAYAQDLQPRPDDTGRDRPQEADGRPDALSGPSRPAHRLGYAAQRAPVANLVDSLAMALPSTTPSCRPFWRLRPRQPPGDPDHLAGDRRRRGRRRAQRSPVGLRTVRTEPCPRHPHPSPSSIRASWRCWSAP